MKTTEVKELLKKYFEGTTNLEEEERLRLFFNSGEVPEELLSFKDHFSFLSHMENDTAFQVPEDELLLSKVRKEHTFEKDGIISFESRRRNVGLKYAASIAFLLIGFAAGYFANHFERLLPEGIGSSEAISEDSKLLVQLTSNTTSASGRIQAVNEAGSMEEIDPEIVKALVYTMNADDNINVRLAAIEGLSRFSSNDTVKLALVQSMTIQENPLVQIALIDLIVKLEEKRGVNQIHRLLIDDKVDQVVKQRAKEGLAVLM